MTDTARRLARELLSPPLPWPARPLLWLVQLPAIGLLPPVVREGYGFSWDARREAALRCSAELARRLLPGMPSSVRYWRAARVAGRVRPVPRRPSPPASAPFP